MNVPEGIFGFNIKNFLSTTDGQQWKLDASPWGMLPDFSHYSQASGQQTHYPVQSVLEGLPTLEGSSN